MARRIGALAITRPDSRMVVVFSVVVVVFCLFAVSVAIGIVLVFRALLLLILLLLLLLLAVLLLLLLLLWVLLLVVDSVWWWGWWWSRLWWCRRSATSRGRLAQLA